jgi:hypothetical protein
MENFAFLQYLVILLVGLLFFREEITPWIKSKLGISDKKNPATSEQMSNLTEYVNHRQTEILAEQTRILASIHDDVKVVIRKHEEWERFGIPTRESKK